MEYNISPRYIIQYLLYFMGDIVHLHFVATVRIRSLACVILIRTLLRPLLFFPELCCCYSTPCFIVLVGNSLVRKRKPFFAFLTVTKV